MPELHPNEFACRGDIVKTFRESNRQKIDGVQREALLHLGKAG